ncbi:MAG: DUF5693 family protein [Armatimonadota bacterium]
MSESRNRFIRLTLWLLVLVGFAAAFKAGINRANVEAANRRVEITLDFNELRNLAATEGLPLSEVLTAFKNAAGQAGGATSIALQEETISSLEEAQLLQEVASGSRGATVLYGTPEVMQGVEEAIQVKTRYRVGAIPSATPLPFGVPPNMTRGLRIEQPNGLVRGIGLGLSPESVQVIRDSGLRIVGRMGNWDGAAPQGIVWALNRLKRDGASTIIFSGDSVLGYKGYVIDDPEEPDRASTKSALRDAELFYGTVEFGKQKGDAALSRASEDRLVRVHTITGAEMQSANPAENVQRFLLAARERNIRCLYVRLFPDEPKPLKENVKYIKRIVDGLAGRGLTPVMVPGLAHGYPELHTSSLVRGLIALGLASGWLLLVDAVTGLFSGGRPGTLVSTVAGAGALLLMALPLAPTSMGVKLAALAAACIFPTLALLRKDALRSGPPDQSPLVVALLRFFTTCAVTLVGAAYIIGLLANRVYLLKIDAFIGSKPAKIVPVLLVALIYSLALRANSRRPWKQALVEARDKIINLSKQPILIWQIAAALAAVIVLAMVVMRAGNDPGIGVSGVEMNIRRLLDQVLPARPRFQEFLIGHPALILAFVLAVRGRRAWAFPLFLIGAIGQVSLLNTFCHLHTPLIASLWRAGIGIAIGVTIGLVLYFFLDRILLRRLLPVPASLND